MKKLLLSILLVAVSAESYALGPYLGTVIQPDCRPLGIIYGYSVVSRVGPYFGPVNVGGIIYNTNYWNCYGKILANPNPGPNPTPSSDVFGVDIKKDANPRQCIREIQSELRGARCSRANSYDLRCTNRRGEFSFRDYEAVECVSYAERLNRD